MKTKKASIRLQEEQFNQKLRHQRIMRQEVELLLGSALFIVLTFFVGLGVGAIVGTAAGINGPDGAVCIQSNMACRWFRVRNPKEMVPSHPKKVKVQKVQSSSQKRH